MKFFYLRDSGGFPVTCVASKFVNRNGSHLVYFDFSTHNPLDRYSRKKAREIAAARLEKNNLHGVYVSSVKGETKRAIVERIASLADSQAAKEAARLWLQNYLVVETEDASPVDDLIHELEIAFLEVSAGKFVAALDKLKKLEKQGKL